jgi:hypothetical protein
VSAATIDRTEMLREAHAALHMATEMPEPRTWALDAAIDGLGDALGLYGEFVSDGLHWECAYPHLRDEADPDGEALRKAAEEVGAAAEDLIKVMAAHCGTENEMTIPGVGK